METRNTKVLTSKGIVEVMGELIKFPNYDDFEFVIYKAPDAPLIWLISEIKTGLILPMQYQCTTKKDLIEQTEIMLNAINQNTLRDLIRKHVIKIVYKNENIY